MQTAAAAAAAAVSQGSIDGNERGLVPRAVQALGEGIEADTSGAEFEVSTVMRAHCVLDQHLCSDKVLVCLPGCLSQLRSCSAAVCLQQTSKGS